MPDVLRCPQDGNRVWFGMTDYEVHSPDGRVVLILPFVGEPPHGDSQHKVLFQDWVLPGFAWGSGLAWSPCSRYLTLDWLSHLGAVERRCIVIDVERRSTFTLPGYEAISRFNYPRLCVGAGIHERAVFEFSGQETWCRVAA
jgi:hypothetical protein